MLLPDCFSPVCLGMLQVLERYIQQYEISMERRWLLQQFLQGPEYSCYTLAYKGRPVAHVDNQAELSCLNYAHVGIPQVGCTQYTVATTCGC